MSNVLQAVQGFFKKPDPKELVRKWQATLRAEQRRIDRSVREIQAEEQKAKRAALEAAKRGDAGAARSLAREIVHSRRAVSRLCVQKAQMIGVGNALAGQLAMVRVAGTLQRSTEVMSVVGSLVRLPEIGATMAAMQREMARAGLIDEVVHDALDSALGGEEVEEEADAEVERVLEEVAAGAVAAAPAAPRRQQPPAARAPAAAQQQRPEEGEEEEPPEELEELQARLDAVRG
jgi:charged multivesicular body protein 3